ncbi:hypothetical protein [Brucella intermedia]|uniref:hypothetical protein n=1 Tax=Brucella intermedia TaxID=94625 RepID=UPI00235E139F|nr:hypothetical protein [Brucella intermedia]
MGQFSMEISGHAGSVLSGNQQDHTRENEIQADALIIQCYLIGGTHIFDYSYLALKELTLLIQYSISRPNRSTSTSGGSSEQKTHLQKAAFCPLMSPSTFTLPKRLGYQLCSGNLLARR